MVAIGLSAGAVARIRFAVSCLWEVVAAVRVLRDPGSHGVHLPWADRVSAPRGTLLWDLVPREPDYLPDFLTPPPPGLTPDLAGELVRLTATPPAVVRQHLDLYAHSTAALRELHTDPQAGLIRLAAEINAFWQEALAPHWPRIQLLLDAEVFAQSRRLAEDGAAVLLNDLHERVSWEGGTLRVSKHHCTAGDVPGGSGLVLVPSVFVWPSVLSVFAGDVPQLAYPARGVATLWESRAGDPEALGAVLGRGRTRLLVELGVPTSTTELAQRTGMTAGGVSQHLTALRAAGLVAAHRHGRSVLNVRTALAEALLSSAR
ncbi:ArsR/SmtB family transcription factor [Actinoplanes friuliensis]|uniref:ArsR family transcriptional regulator n=1 Tax=Actinoplanes friuliensis DSM 7358 TaxID=1246995 RepID=U5VXP8_9ACTN|nr:ArsR family transcriptional regulator [Actinoplanes friuliensis]AGZ40510.1 ArsR family transcriptional regulator [Actinoplanes friuliensis DSM 7358]